MTKEEYDAIKARIRRREEIESFFMIKERIRAEVVRLLKEWRWHSSIEGKYRCEIYRELIEFIDSLPEEPAGEDLKEMAYRYAIKCEPLRDSYGSTTFPNPEIKSAIIYGANWQKKRLPKWKKSKDPDGLYWSIDEATIVFKGYTLDLTELEDVLEKED